MAPADVDPAEVTALLSVPLDEFVAARTARVKELKAEGRKDEAAALATVRKPVRLVWIVGELARRNPEVAEQAAAVAEELEDAQSGGGGVRPLLKRFRDVVGQVAGLAEAVEGNVDVLEVGLALREVLADARARDDWIEGRLLALPGDEDDDAPADELAPRRAKKAATKAAAKRATKATSPDEDEEAEAAARKAEEEARAEERRAAEDAVAAAEAELEAAGSARVEAVAGLEELEQQLAALEVQVEEARTRLADDDAATDELRAEIERARAVLADLPAEPRARSSRRRR